MVKFEIKSTADKMRESLNQMTAQQKEELGFKIDGVQLLDYETTQNKDLLDTQKLNEDIKILDKNFVQNIIFKSQRLHLFKKFQLYKELGYETLEDFAVKEHKISRVQLHKYVTVYETLEILLLSTIRINSINNDVKSTLHLENLSIEKLYLISRIDEDEKVKELFETICNKNISVSQLKKQIEQKENQEIKEIRIAKNLTNNFIGKFNNKLEKRKKFHPHERELLEKLREKINTILNI